VKATSVEAKGVLVAVRDVVEDAADVATPTLGCERDPAAGHAHCGRRPRILRGELVLSLV